MTSDSRARRVATVAGAGGFLGTAVTRALVDAGWAVRGLVRTPARLSEVERAGGRGVVADILDLPAVRRATKGSSLLVHVAAAGSSDADEPGRARRVRVEGCQNLLTAAKSEHVARVIVGSGYWVYADNPGTISEASPVDPRGESRVNFDAELVAMDPHFRGSTEVIIVRPGMVYGEGSWCRGVLDQIRAGTYAYIAGGTNPWSFVSRDDTGSGFARIAEDGVPGEVYNLVDGRPAAWKEFGDFLAQGMGCPLPGTISPEEARSIYGPDVAHHLGARRACSSSKIERLGWRPLYPEFREGVSRTILRLG